VPTVDRCHCNLSKHARLQKGIKDSLYFARKKALFLNYEIPPAIGPRNPKPSARTARPFSKKFIRRKKTDRLKKYNLF
jgi:hypothetical protein